MLQRRGLLLGLLAAPAIIRTPGLLMPVKPQLKQASDFVGNPLFSSDDLVWDGIILRETRVKPRLLTGLGLRGDEIIRGDEEFLDLQMEFRTVRPNGTVVTDWTPEPRFDPEPLFATARKPRLSRYTNKGVRHA